MNNYCLSAVVLVGDICVGKTHLLINFLGYDYFDKELWTKINWYELFRTMYIGSEVIRVQIWDTCKYCMMHDCMNIYIYSLF